MKNYKLFLFIFLISLFSIFFILKNISEPDKQEIPGKYPDEWFAYQRIYPDAKIKTRNYIDAMKSAVEMQKSSIKNNIAWEFAGPTNIGGRITDIEIHQNNPTTIYLGTASGGILKTENNGNSWENIFSNLPTISIGDIAIDPNNENIIYAGTGESNSSSYSFFGSGIYKTENAGETWENIGLENSNYIGRIIVDYSNSEKLFAASCGNLFTQTPDRGIYRSIDSGNNWERVLFVSDSTSAIDIVQNLDNPEILYAAMWERMRGLDYRRSFGQTSGIYKTEDGGDTWSELTNGLPTDETVGRIGLTISESNPNVLYAVYNREETGNEVYKTTNGGDTWTATNDGNLGGMSSTFGWYFGQIRVNPQDENQVFTMGVSFYKTETGGSSWSESGGNMHVDHHALEFTNDRIWVGNDGGLYFSTNGGTYWTKVNNLPLTQFYDIAIDSIMPERLYGGTQDNNSIRTSSGNVDDWEALLGGDGMYCLVDYTNPNIFYCEYQWGGLYRFENGYGYDISYGFYGDRTNWSTPYVLHPNDPNILYLGTYKIYKTTNKGDSWTSISNDLTQGGESNFHTISTIDISKINPDIIITGTSDGKVHISENDGLQWTDISSGLPERWITRVKTDPFDANTIYATVSGFRWDEYYSHVYKSTNLGETWESIGDNLPEIPVNVIVLDPDVQDRIFVGTDAGIFMTENGGNNWYGISQGIANVPVTAMEFHHSERKIFVGTYGLSAYKANIPLESIIVSVYEIQNSKFTIFPNPFKAGKQQANISVKTEKNQSVEFSVFDIKGKKIYSENIFINSENQIINWKGTDNSGNILSKGIYICKIKTSRKIYSEKIIIN